MEWRKAIAELDVELAPYKVLGAQVVKELCKRRPVDLATLKSVDGMSDAKVASYGADVIKVRVESLGWANDGASQLRHGARLLFSLAVLVRKPATSKQFGTFLVQSRRPDDACWHQGGEGATVIYTLRGVVFFVKVKKVCEVLSSSVCGV